MSTTSIRNTLLLHTNEKGGKVEATAMSSWGTSSRVCTWMRRESVDDIRMGWILMWQLQWPVTGHPVGMVTEWYLV